jgi:hypothetical protein
VNGNAANSSWTGGAASSSTLGNLAVGSSAAQLSNLNGKWLQGTDLPTSTVTVSGSTSKITYATSTASLFGSSGRWPATSIRANWVTAISVVDCRSGNAEFRHHQEHDYRQR